MRVFKTHKEYYVLAIVCTLFTLGLGANFFYDYLINRSYRINRKKLIEILKTRSYHKLVVDQHAGYTTYTIVFSETEIYRMLRVNSTNTFYLTDVLQLQTYISSYGMNFISKKQTRIIFDLLDEVPDIG